MAIRTVADLKRALRPGVVVTITEHMYPALNGERRVVRAQTQRFTMSLPADHPRYDEVPESWVDFPKAAHLRPNDDGSVTILHDWRDKAEAFYTLRVKEG